MDSFTVSDIIDYDDSDIRPVIVEFQNGRLNSSNVQHDVYTKNRRTFVKIETKMTYKGEVKRDPVCNSYLCVVDKKTQQATLVPVDYALLAPDVKNEEVNEEESENDYSSALRTLKKEFGSKRMKLSAQQEERMKINTSNTTKSLEAAVAEMEVDEDDLETSTVNTETTYTPPINRDAETVEEVYNLYDLVPKEVLSSLDECVAQIFDGADLDPIHTDLVKTSIQKKLDLDRSKRVEQHCKVLLVVDCILNFLSLPIKVISHKKYIPCEYSQQVSQYILNNFTVIGRSGRNRSASMKDKAICHCMVLLAIINNFVVNLDELCKALKLKINKLQSIAKLLAFVPQHVKDRTTVVLKLPLPPPVQNLGRTPKKKR